MKSLSFICLIWVCTLLGCAQYPKDPESSLKHLQGGTLRVGIAHHPPFTIVHNGTYSGSEVELIKHYADQKNATIAWTHDSETALAEKLNHYELDVMVSGLVKQSPIAKKLGYTQAYMEDDSGKHVMAVAPGENALLTDLDGFLVSQTDNQQP